jgi:hypothetical protein
MSVTEGTVSKFVRTLTLVLGFGSLVVAVAFYFQWSFVQDFWPWAQEVTASSPAGPYGYGSVSSTVEVGNLSRLSYYFVSSVGAAVAIPMIWIALSGEFAALVGGAINMSLMYSGITIYAFQSYADNTDNERLLIAGIICLAMVIGSLLLLLWSRRLPFEDQRPTPIPVRLSFVIFVIALLVAAASLLLERQIFPWALAPEVAVVYGWVFLGTSTYFAYGVLVPRWHNAAGQLLGFLAYDLVLILPFIDHFSTVDADHRLSLILYTVTVIFSALVAIYYLFVHPTTRIWFSGSAKLEQATA